MRIFFPDGVAVKTKRLRRSREGSLPRFRNFLMVSALFPSLGFVKSGKSRTAESDLKCGRIPTTNMPGERCRINRSMQHYLNSASDNTSPAKRTCLALLAQNLARIAFWVI